MKKILIIGNGGREHALAWKCAQSKSVEKIFVAPGNAGTALESKCENIDIKADDINTLLTFAKEHNIDLTIVGPEQPLVAGIVDVFEKEGLRIFGPSAVASQLEGSKAFTKDFLKKHNIPTAAYEVFEDVDKAEKYIRAQGAPIVIKADGLAAGKGVLVAQNVEEAVEFTKECLSGNKFGSAGSRVVVEEFMRGEEASYICIVSGRQILPLATSQDHKLSQDGDKGQNTGGMGAYSPAPVVTKDVEEKILKKIIKPTINGMADDGAPFVGFLYAGLMLDQDGNPRVVEYNVRFGDPETQPILMRLEDDLVELLEAALNNQLSALSTKWSESTALGVVMTAGGYPESYEKGFEISGLDQVAQIKNVKVFHAGTERSRSTEEVVTSGGRVLCVTALGADIKEAQQKAYEAVNKITWEGERHRTDIGWRAV